MAFSPTGFPWQWLWLPTLALLAAGAWHQYPAAPNAAASSYYWSNLLLSISLLLLLSGLLCALLSVAVWRRLPYLERVARLYPAVVLAGTVALGVTDWLAGS